MLSKQFKLSDGRNVIHTNCSSSKSIIKMFAAHIDFLHTLPESNVLIYI